MLIIAAITYFFWAVLGLIFWIPLLVRVIAGFCSGLVFNMVVNNPQRIHASKMSLDIAISFYARGFQIIYSTLYEKPNPSTSMTETEFNFMSFLGQVLWTLFFWGIIIFPYIKYDVYAYVHTWGYTTIKYVEEADKNLNIHDTTTAISMITQAIEKDKYNAELYFKRGMLFYNTSKFEKAINDLESAMKLDTIKFAKTIEISWKIATTYSEILNQNEKAISYYTKIIKHFPEYSYAYFQRGLCYDRLNKNDLAINDYNAAINSNPNLGIAYNNKAGILYNKGLKEEACALYDQAIRAGYAKAQKYKNELCK